MGITRTLLRPVAMAAGLHAARQRRAFLLAHRRTRQVQQQVLGELIRAHERTGFGRDHAFDRIRGYEDFKSAVPVRTYEELRPYVQRVLNGQTEALLPPGEQVLMFSLTSGTTGRPKHIPVTRRFLANLRMGWNVFGLSVLRDHPQGWLRPILQISSSMHKTDSPTGIPCGAVSGLLARTQKRIVRRMYVVPPEAGDPVGAAAKYYTILRAGVGRDVGIITTANPSSTIKLIETGAEHLDRLLRDVADGTLRPPGGAPGRIADRLRFRPNRRLAARIESGVKRDGGLRARHFWNIAFLTNWTGGTVGLYLPRLRELFGQVPIRDIGLLASEGRFSIPLADGAPAGVAEIVSNFLEFVPADRRDGDSPPTMLAHEVEVGGEYFLVVTNWAGLWRYDLDDRVRVTGRLGKSPVLEFLSRGSHTANITGEKITEHQVVEAMRLAAGEIGAELDLFVVQGRFAKTPYYELRLEAADGACGEVFAKKLAEAMDRRLAALNIEYRSKRESGRLGAIRHVRLAPGVLSRIERENIQARRGRTEQYKHQYLLTDVLSEPPAP